MLKEEAYHVSTGNFGLTRIVQTGKIPTEIIQRYLNRWVPTAFDLFGNDHSSSAHWAYVWGLKGRFDERENPEPANSSSLKTPTNPNVLGSTKRTSTPLSSNARKWV